MDNISSGKQKHNSLSLSWSGCRDSSFPRTNHFSRHVDLQRSRLVVWVFFCNFIAYLFDLVVDPLPIFIACVVEFLDLGFKLVIVGHLCSGHGSISSFYSKLSQVSAISQQFVYKIGVAERIWVVHSNEKLVATNQIETSCRLALFLLIPNKVSSCVSLLDQFDNSWQQLRHVFILFATPVQE